MPRFEQAFREICSLADSKRISDKRRSIVKLKELYKSNAAIEELCNNSRDRDSEGTNWKAILHSVHNVLLHEAERSVSGDPNRSFVSTSKLTSDKETKVMTDYGMTMVETVKRANSSEIHLDCNTLLPLVLQIFSDQQYVVYQRSYLTILVKHVLCVEHYKTSISPVNWRELLKLTIKMYEVEHPYIDKYFILKAICEIIEKGSTQSHLALKLKKIFPFLVKVFSDAKSDPRKLSDVTFKLANIVCRRVGAESRIALCDFGETVLPCAINLNGSYEKYDWMLLMVQAHHPGGVTKYDNGAYAFNFEKWNEILPLIYCMVLKNSAMEFASDSFVQLASEVLWQLKDDCTYVDGDGPSDEVDYAHPSKRRRTVIGIQGMIDTLTTVPLEESLISIKILIVLMTRHSDSIKMSHVLPLMEFLITHLSTCQNENILNQLWELARALVELDSNFVNDLTENDAINSGWDKIWSVALTSASTNKHEERVHGLLQSFISHGKSVDPNSILNLYLKSNCTWSKASIRTLLVFCKHNIIQNDTGPYTNDNCPTSSNNSPVKVRLLQWILAVPPGMWNAQIPIEDFCELLVGLTLRSWYDIDRKDATNICQQSKVETQDIEDTTGKGCHVTSFEDACLMTAFKGSLCDKTDTKNIPHSKQTNGCVLHINENIDFLVNNLVEKNAAISDKEPADSLIVQTAVVARIFSNFMYLKISHEKVENLLGHIIEQSLKEISLSVEEIVQSKKKRKRNHLMNVLEALHLLYNGPYDYHVADLIRRSTGTDMLKYILLLTNVDNLHNIDGELRNNDGSTSITYIKNINHLSHTGGVSKQNEEFQTADTLSNVDTIRLKASAVLAAFCGMLSGEDISRVQENLLITILNPNTYDLSEISDFKMAVTILESLIERKFSSFSEKIITDALKMVQQLCRYWHKNNEAARIIINILSKLLTVVGYAGTAIQKQNILRILSQFHKLLQNNEYGPTTYVAFIQCLETIAEIDPSFAWTKWEAVDSTTPAIPIMNELLVYVKSPFHVVRLKVIDCLRILFSSEDVNLEWLKEFFDKLRTAITELFIIEREVKERVKEDERTNRISSALHVMVIVISYSAIFRSRALLSVFQLTVDKNINPEIVKKAFERVNASLQIKDINYLIEDKLNYLLTHWLEDGYSIEKFPIILMGCKSEQEFYNKYMDIIAFIVIQRGDVEEIPELCTKFGMSFKNVIEDCFPRLISWLLPYISADQSLPNNFVTPATIQRANSVYNQLNSNLKQFKTVQKVSVLVKNNLESVIVTMITRLHDEEHSMQFLNIPINYPSDDPPEFKHCDIQQSFKFLEDNIIGTKSSLLHFLATEKPEVLQKVLMKLKCRMHEGKSVEFKLKALHHYVYFAMMIMEEINNNYFDGMSAYVVRDICHTLMNLLKGGSLPLSKAACDYFYYLLMHMLPKRCAEVKQNLRLIVSSMIPIVKAGKTRHAIDIITFLIVEKSDLLAEAIERLDSFPPDEVFRQVREKHFRLRNKNCQRQTLDDEVRHFLSTRRENMENCSITELDHLKEQLSTRKQELQEMYRSLGLMKRFSEDCASSVLHQLTCALVKLTISSDTDISLRAATCLGELGPADLTTMILQPEKEHSKQFLDPMQTFTYRILVLLSNLLIHPDVRVFTATSEALYIITASFWGMQIVSNKNLRDLKTHIESSEECLRIEYIKPFVGKSSEQKNVNTINVKKFKESVNDNEDLWIGKANDSHSDWITNMVCQILDCFNGSYMRHLIPVCRANVSFCEKMLPWIIYLVIHIEKKLDVMIYASINLFFRCHYADSSEKNKNNSQLGGEHRNICFNHKSVQCMLNVVEFIRSQSVEKYKMELEYLHIAKAAQYCSAYFTSVLYAELWCECFHRACPTSDHLLSIDHICETNDEHGKALQEILREAFIKIGDPDAIYGCGTSYYQDPSERIQHYVQLRKWDKVLLAHDIEMSLGNKTASKGLLDALYQSGLQYLLGAFVRTIDKTDDEKDDTYRYECAWRLSDWNIPDTQQMMNWKDGDRVDFQTILSTDHPLFHYRALKFYHESDTDRLKTALDSARISVIKTLRNISLESCKAVYPALSQLQMLREIEEVYFAEPDAYNSMIEKWKHQDAIGVNDFEYIEPVLSQRAILLQARGKVESKVIKSALIDTYLQLTELSKKYGYFQMAARALGSLAKQVGTLTDEERNNLQYQEAKLAWVRGDHELGRHLLRNLIVNGTSNVIQSEALTTYGNWMAETKSENPQKIIDKYYRASLEGIRLIENPTERERQNFVYTQAVLAQFADVQFQQILTYMKSPQFESFRACVAYSERTADNLSAYSKDADEKRAKFLNQKQCNNDMAELENIEKEKNMYLLLALENYMRTLEQSEDHNLLVFRLVSLWLDNKRDSNLNELMQANLHKLPSYKFILLVPQLAPHISDTNDEFSTKIFNLLERCAIEHPHHTIPVLLALMNLHKDHDFQNSKRTSTVKPEPRVLGATKLVQQLMTTSIKPIIEEMDKLANSLIMLANLEPPKTKSQRIPVPNKPLSITKMRNFQHTLVPTMSIDIKPNKDYNGIVSIIRYADSYELVGGINAPKKITCLCTDGQRKNQLVKGKDDLRQDAVMQQVFTVMNMLLRTSKEANKRKLNVRTYKVVPLTQRSGILEWCDETTPIYEILGGSSNKMGLHQKYYPKDYSIKQCRDIMAAVAKTSNPQKLAKYNQCCEHLHPVFHYFFLENFLSPEIWFERRLSYVHSVATTSIIGYILGLGDRHLNNILIDKTTAEVIHIDFGIAFEQGKILPTPETVPFRLTRDMEVAMGVSGAEGVLRRSCEETMTVLRDHRNVIITLIQVLSYDPLFSWSITPAKAFSLQQGSTQGSSEGSEASGTKNKLAERALLRLDQKLRGTEEGSASSVAGQVEKLIQEARDPINLSRLFCGWQAYL